MKEAREQWRQSAWGKIDSWMMLCAGQIHKAAQRGTAKRELSKKQDGICLEGKQVL